jgi:hypothetical protein
VNPYEDLTRALSTDWLFGLPSPVRPGLLDAMSFEDTEIALSRLFGGLLPAEGTRPVVTGPGRAPVARPGDVPPVRFGHPRPNRTGQEPLTTTESAAVDPQWMMAERVQGELPVTRLGRGAATLADVLRASAAAPVSGVEERSMSTVDDETRPGVNGVPWRETRARTEIEHPELDGPGNDASGSVHNEPGGHNPALVTPARLASPDASDDPWSEQGALADLVLERLRDEVELEFQRTYGLGEG